MNQITKIKSYIKGFTLVEVLVGIAIFAVLGLVSIDLLTRTFQGNNKAKLIVRIKQNGQVALNTIDENIRDADSVACIDDFNILDTNPTDTIVTVNNSQYTRIRFNLKTASSSGSITLDNPTVTTQDLATLCTDPQTQTTILTDTNVNSGISIISGSFIIDRSPGFKDIITVQFQIGPPMNAFERFDTKIDPIPFETTVTLR